MFHFFFLKKVWGSEVFCRHCMVYKSALSASLNRGVHTCSIHHLPPVGYFIYQNYSWKKMLCSTLICVDLYLWFCTVYRTVPKYCFFFFHWFPDKTLNKSKACTMQKCMLVYPQFLVKLALLARGNSFRLFKNTVLSRMLLNTCM